MAFRGHRGPSGSSTKEKLSRPILLLLRRMFGYLGPFKRVVALGAVLSLIATVLSVISPFVITKGIDLVFYTSGNVQGIIYLVILYFALKIIVWIFNGIYTWILSGAQANFVQSVQKDVYDHLIDADLSYHKGEQSGNVTSRVTSDTVSLATGIQMFIDVAGQLLMLVATFILLWTTSVLIALTSLLVVPGIAFMAVLFGTVGKRIMLASQRAYGKVSGQIAENLSGIHVAKAFNREEELAEDMLKLNEKAYQYGKKFLILMTSMQPLMRGIGMFVTAALLFVGSSLVVGTAPLMSVGEVFLGILLVQKFMWPLLFLSMTSSQVQASLAAMDRVSDVLESKPAICDSPDAVPLRETSDGITFDHVTFWYVEGTEVLKDVSFTIRPGETVALVGHTGAGKTTVAALINRFYDPQKGKVLIGDQNLRDVTLASLHDAISLIPQEPYLFDGTIIENIRYGREDATEEEIIELCKIIGADEFIEVLSEGYQTLVIENGKNLSAGQRQMITIARTMLANPRILILDEATSRLDAYSEALVQDAQAKLFSERTTVVIAHRLTTIANASRIIVFDHGKIVEEGTTEELLALGGAFRKLYDTYYAHQGVGEISEDILRVASEEVSKDESNSSSPPQMPFAMMGGGPPPGMAMGMGQGSPNPEKMRQMMERMSPETRARLLANPSKLPPAMREMLEKYEKKK
ncbi:MAG: ABC transporter ATP-binding protein/permease [Candidatus Thorarchaeota archaeon]|nr:ABC transporter ATP-binding protein/permease [Candidatus Thorarchaeota archaeon]